MTGDLIIVTFNLDHEDWHGRPSEGLWAEPIAGATPGSALRWRNSPFFVRDVSFQDIVRAVRRGDDGRLEFAGVVDRGGHSTFMLLVPPTLADFAAYWGKLQELGCTYESKKLRVSLGDRVLYSVDVPPTADIDAVRSTLEDGERKNVWMFQEGHVGHRLKSE
jgi:hypothetical protein